MRLSRPTLRRAITDIGVSSPLRAPGIPPTQGAPSRTHPGRAPVALLLVVAVLVACVSGCGPQPTSTQETNAGVEFLHKPSPQHLRVMNFNPYWDSIFPDDDPQNDRWRQHGKSAEFVRIVQAVQPDILCLQEINPARDPQQVADILAAVLPRGQGESWHAHSGEDNVIAARFDLLLRDSERVIPGTSTGFGHAVALVDLPDAEYAQDLYLVCAHFKSQGGQANIEARQAHADAIVHWMRDLETPGGTVDLPAGTPIVVLGDFNVYDTDPAYHLTTLLTGDIVNEANYGPDTPPDWDGTPLADALPRHNGTGEETYTWRDDTQPYNPGALDRILYTDSVLSVDHAFVLNTMAMAEADLEAAGLEAGDVLLNPSTGHYDHLPLVVDVALRGPGEGP
jgi:endonuclease/exonuclease/phosphatase family metal-dependent hydrolase